MSYPAIGGGATMEMTARELWTALHGMVFGAGFLLAFSGGVAGLWGLRQNRLTQQGADQSQRALAVCTWCMAILAWLAVIIGSYVIYPWYRAKPPPNTTGPALAGFPKFLLLSKPQTADWHEFGMEWKEHIAWFVPMLATAVAYVVTRYGRLVARDDRLRRALLFLFTVSFFCAAVAGVFGALINKAAPTR
jgi:hypothetical protein